jgi:rRNA-processing protein EBP2
MAKKGTTQSPKAGSKPKSPVTNNQSKKQKTDRRKSNEPVVEKVVEENEEEWVDEEDEKPAPKANGRKSNKKQPKVEVEELSEEDGDSDDSEDDEEMGGIDLAGIDESDSESELDSDDGQDNDDEEEEIDVDELSAIDEEDEEQIAAGTRVRQTINNKEGLLSALRRIALPTDPKTVPFAFHQTVVSSKLTEESIPSIDDDLERELAFMNQSLEAARQGRALLRKENVPFTRPTDYFAETVRSDETMEKVKAKMVEEATAKKASAEARKLRDLKKFGKQVQVQKQQERAKQKRDTLDKIKDLKRSMHPPPSLIRIPHLPDVPLTNPLFRTPRRRLSRPRRHRSRRPLRRGRGQRARQQQEARRARQRQRRPQFQAAKEGLQVWLWRQEALRQVQRRQVGRRPERFQRQAHEERRRWRPRWPPWGRWWWWCGWCEEEVCQGDAPG